MYHSYPRTRSSVNGSFALGASAQRDLHDAAAARRCIRWKSLTNQKYRCNIRSTLTGEAHSGAKQQSIKEPAMLSPVAARGHLAPILLVGAVIFSACAPASPGTPAGSTAAQLA